MSFQPYAVSLGLGLLVGVFYGLIKVRSPAPPMIALIGLLGMVVGEQLIPAALHAVSAWHANGRAQSAKDI
jgi:XapX domain-containing protein